MKRKCKRKDKLCNKKKLNDFKLLRFRDNKEFKNHNKLNKN